MMTFVTNRYGVYIIEYPVKGRVLVLAPIDFSVLLNDIIYNTNGLVTIFELAPP